VTFCGLWYLLNYVTKVLNTLMLVAAMLWSGVCFAECRVLPKTPKSQAKSTVPPCHKQKQEAPAKPCVDPAACVFEAAPEDHQLQKQLSLSDVHSIPAMQFASFFDGELPVFSANSADLRGVLTVGSRPRASVLRI
jgi:hypothetical protein